MDIIDRHFAAENAHDVEGTLATYTDDIVWDDITHPDSPFRGKENVGAVYSGIIDAIPAFYCANGLITQVPIDWDCE